MAKLTSSSVTINSYDLEASNVSDTDTFTAAGSISAETNAWDEQEEFDQNDDLIEYTSVWDYAFNGEYGTYNWFALAHARSVVGPDYDYTGNGAVNVSVGAGKYVEVEAVVLTENDNGATVADVDYSVGDNYHTNWQYSDFAKLVLTGAGNVYFDNSEASSAATAGGATVDASAMTGTSSLTYWGNQNQTDYVTLGAGKDLVGIYGSTTALYDRVTGFGAADKVMLVDSDIVAGDDWAGKLTIDSGVTSVSGAIANALAQLDTETVGYFQYGGNTYVVEDGSDDYAIQLVGTLTLTADNILFA